jgi:hypothetical protein
MQITTHVMNIYKTIMIFSIQLETISDSNVISFSKLLLSVSKKKHYKQSNSFDPIFVKSWVIYGGCLIFKIYNFKEHGICLKLRIKLVQFYQLVKTIKLKIYLLILFWTLCLPAVVQFEHCVLFCAFLYAFFMI